MGGLVSYGYVWVQECTGMIKSKYGCFSELWVGMGIGMGIGT